MKSHDSHHMLWRFCNAAERVIQRTKLLEWRCAIDKCPGKAQTTVGEEPIILHDHTHPTLEEIDELLAGMPGREKKASDSTPDEPASPSDGVASDLSDGPELTGSFQQMTSLCHLLFTFKVNTKEICEFNALHLCCVCAIDNKPPNKPQWLYRCTACGSCAACVLLA